MNRAKVISVAMASAWLFSPSAFSLEPPNDIDLKASYCLGFMTARVSAMRSFLDVLAKFKEPEPRAMADDMRKKILDVDLLIDRFNHYLSPRLKYLDQAGLVSAVKQAAADAGRYYNFDEPEKARSNQLADQCSTECKGVAASKYKFSACYKSCVQRDDLGARVWRCEEAQFLPY